MQIFIQHHGEQTGPFTTEQVRAGLSNGTYQSSTLAWHAGAPGWIPLASIPGIGSHTPPPIPGGSVASPAASQTSTLAIWSLVLGILALPSVGLAAIPAVICGHIALGNIKKSAGTQTGGGMAIAGLIMGYLGVLILSLAMLSGLAAPLVIRQRKKANQAEAMNNARSFGVALYEFKTEYGRFPDETTAVMVAETTETRKISGSSSNDRFRQLIHSGISGSETPFYANVSGTRKPDGLIAGDDAIAPGECGFAYVENVVTTDEIARPLAMAPFFPGTLRFDHKPFENKAVILWTDNSVRSLPIDRSTGEVALDGKNLLDPDHPIWSGKPPVIALPE